ncbi:hypothetical protein PCANC_18681 [Puccinia coronata f. sp. avenae]|uniref:Uncharacterized protein n=1 Tax=Puccinia coronata f. sp. avenae TaxID=200324 RepID=A0A2N5VC75_9BASI|nr:hypothetical protein PCANC_18681 [Puccinia coronata f. sp. avenae]
MSVDSVIESNINLEAERQQAEQHEEQLRLLEGLVQRHEKWISEADHPEYQPTLLEPLESSQARLTRLEHLVARQENWLENIGFSSGHFVQPPELHNDEWTPRLEYLKELTGHHENWLNYDRR